MGSDTTLSTVQNSIWSGFAAYGDHFRYVTATYSIPSINCTISPDASYDSEWVGLDGYGSATVEEIGTTAECLSGTPYYYSFYDMNPSAPVYYSNVSAGDSITASVYYNGSDKQWNLSLVDNTTPATTVTQSLPCSAGSSCQNVSAEIISEVPEVGTVVDPLAFYGTVGFTQIGITDAAVHRGNLFSTHWKNDKITEVDSGGNVMQAPSKLEGSESGTGGGYKNQAFTDTSLSSS